MNKLQKTQQISQINNNIKLPKKHYLYLFIKRNYNNVAQ